MTAIPQTWDRKGLQDAGFNGFLTVAALRENDAAIPGAAGVYVVLVSSTAQPEFLEKSSGGWFKRKDPSVPRDSLVAVWVPDSPVVYIGKTGGGESDATLRSRLRKLLQFGAGRPVGHWGGRYLWHLPYSDGLLVAWREADQPRDEERDLIAEFGRIHAARPFANLVG